MSKQGNGGEAAGLTQVQERFLKRCRRDPKPLAVLLRECQVSVAAFARWRAEEVFEREFRRMAVGLTRDAMSDLRFTFALCGRIISSEVLRVHEGMGKGEKPAEVKEGEKVAGPGVAAVVGEEKEGKGKKGKKGARPRYPMLGVGDNEKAEVYRLCFEVIKVGMGVFVPKAGRGKRRGRAGLKVKPEALARLRQAQMD